jgi:hypothetical protein
MARDFNERYDLERTVRVLEHGFSSFEPVVGPRQTVPVAYWRGPDLCAVMHVRWSAGTGEIDDGLVGWVHVVSSHDDGWRELTRFRDGEFDHPLARPELGPREVTGVHGWGSGDDDAWYSGITGVAGTDAAFVEVVDGTSVSRHPVDSPIGVFVACWRGRTRHTIRVLDRAGEVLFEGPVEFPETTWARTTPSGGPRGITGFSGRAMAALSDGSRLGEVYVMLQRLPECDSDGFVMVDGEVAYGSWWGYLEFPAPVPRSLMRRVEDFETVVIRRSESPRIGPPGDPIRVAPVSSGGDIGGPRRFLVYEAGDPDEDSLHPVASEFDS